MDLSGRRIAWLVLVGIVSALAWASNLAAGSAPKDAVYKYSTAVNELILFAIILAIVLWISNGMPMREAFALRRPRSWSRAAWLAVAVFIAIALVNAITNPFLHASREQGLTPSRWEPSHAAAFALNLVALALVGPLVEELTFRGLGFRLLEPFGRAFAVAAIGIAFALWHGLPAALPVLFVFGAGVAYLRARTGSIYPGMILHVTFNAAALIAAVTI